MARSAFRGTKIPADINMTRLGQVMAGGRHGDQDELMAQTAACSGLRWGEIAALTIGQIWTAARVITADRKVVEIAGHLFAEPPKNRKYRRTVYPRPTPYWRSSNFSRKVLKAACLETGGATSPAAARGPHPACGRCCRGRDVAGSTDV